MPDYFSNLGRQNLFPLRAPSIFQPNMGQEELPPEYDMMQRLAELYQPQNQIGDAFSQALQNIPQRQEPGKLQKIFGAMAGLGAGAGPSTYVGGAAVGFRGNPLLASQTQEQITNKPYYDALQDWQLGTEALGKGAELENRQNVNQRILANEIIGRELQEKGLAERNRAALEKEQQNRIKSDQIYEVKLADLQRKADQAEATLAQRKAEADARADNMEAMMKYRDAALAATNARFDLGIAQKDRALEESKRLHDTMAQKWKEEAEDREKRLQQYEEQLGIKKQPTTTKTEVTKEGNKSTTIRTTTPVDTGKQPTDNLRQQAIDLLKANKKVVNEETIKAIMDRLAKNNKSATSNK